MKRATCNPSVFAILRGLCLWIPAVTVLLGAQILRAADAPSDLVALEQAAVAGDAEAQFALGERYWRGTGGAPARDDLAVQWWTTAARQMHAGALFALGNAVAKGRGAPRHPGRAIALWKHAAELGHAGAMTALGKAYAHGAGTAPDVVEAVRWFQRAAARGDAEAEYCLGWHYENGVGVEPDPVQAAICYLNAAEQGVAAAQNSIGVLYAQGRGVPKNLLAAHLWLSRAAAAGDPHAPTHLKAVSQTMSWTERRKARAQWAEFLRRADETTESVPTP